MIVCRRKTEGKKEAMENGRRLRTIRKPDNEREINNMGEERETEHGVPYALASAAYGRAGDESRSGDRGVSEREPNTRQYTRSRRDARISCMFCHRPGGGGGEGEARETAINTALRVRVSRSLHGTDIDSRFSQITSVRIRTLFRLESRFGVGRSE